MFLDFYFFFCLNVELGVLLFFNWTLFILRVVVDSGLWSSGMSGFTFVFLSEVKTADDKFQYKTLHPFFHVPDTEEGLSTWIAHRMLKYKQKIFLYWD